jgi:hypothetical protein
MTRDEVIDYVTRELEGTLVVVASEENGAPEVAWGDTFFFYDPDDITVPEKAFAVRDHRGQRLPGLR